MKRRIKDQPFRWVTRRIGYMVLLYVRLWNHCRWSSQEDGSRRFVIIKYFMENYNAPFPYGKYYNECPDTNPFEKRNIKKAFPALFIRSVHKRCFTISSHPYLSVFLSLFRFLALFHSTTTSQGHESTASVVLTTNTKLPCRLACSSRDVFFFTDLINVKFNRFLDQLFP